jgi:alkanesulfonate monooxygenase SsuD/methylene tetrahydromethanopterin reductase-like flavin-dependent oxidoreductase (luciferase family)
MLSRQVYVAETNAKARAEAEEHILTFFRESPVLRRYEGKLELLRQANRTERNVTYKPGEAPPAPVSTEISFERFQREGFCIIGDPDYVTAEIRRQQKAMGVGVLLTYVPFATLPIAQATRSIELFAREVLPHLREGGGG